MFVGGQCKRADDVKEDTRIGGWRGKKTNQGLNRDCW